MNRKRLNDDRRFSKHQCKCGGFCVNYRGAGSDEFCVKWGWSSVADCLMGVCIELDRGGSCTDICLFCMVCDSVDKALG